MEERVAKAVTYWKQGLLGHVIRRDHSHCCGDAECRKADYAEPPVLNQVRYSSKLLLGPLGPFKCPVSPVRPNPDTNPNPNPNPGVVTKRSSPPLHLPTSSLLTARTSIQVAQSLFIGFVLDDKMVHLIRMCIWDGHTWDCESFANMAHVYQSKRIVHKKHQTIPMLVAKLDKNEGVLRQHIIGWSLRTRKSGARRIEQKQTCRLVPRKSTRTAAFRVEALGRLHRRLVDRNASMPDTDWPPLRRPTAVVRPIPSPTSGQLPPAKPRSAPARRADLQMAACLVAEEAKVFLPTVFDREDGDAKIEGTVAAVADDGVTLIVEFEGGLEDEELHVADVLLMLQDEPPTPSAPTSATPTAVPRLHPAPPRPEQLAPSSANRAVIVGPEVGLQMDIYSAVLRSQPVGWRDPSSSSTAPAAPPRPPPRPLDSLAIASQLVQRGLHPSTLSCPCCRCELSAELPDGVTRVQCDGCGAAFHVDVPLPAQKRRPVLPSKHAPCDAAIRSLPAALLLAADRSWLEGSGASVATPGSLSLRGSVAEKQALLCRLQPEAWAPAAPDKRAHHRVPPRNPKRAGRSNAAGYSAVLAEEMARVRADEAAAGTQPLPSNQVLKRAAPVASARYRGEAETNQQVPARRQQRRRPSAAPRQPRPPPAAPAACAHGPAAPADVVMGSPGQRGSMRKDTGLSAGEPAADGSQPDSASKASSAQRPSKGARSVICCPKGHELTTAKAFKELQCDGDCGKPIAKGASMYTCEPCDHDVCIACAGPRARRGGRQVDFGHLRQGDAPAARSAVAPAAPIAPTAPIAAVTAPAAAVAPAVAPTAAPTVDRRTHPEAVSGAREGQCFVAAMLAHTLELDLASRRPSHTECTAARSAAGITDGDNYLPGDKQMQLAAHMQVGYACIDANLPTYTMYRPASVAEEGCKFALIRVGLVGGRHSEPLATLGETQCRLLTRDEARALLQRRGFREVALERSEVCVILDDSGIANATGNATDWAAAAASRAAEHDLQQLQRGMRRMGAHGSLQERDAHRVAQAQRLAAAHGSDDAQRARGTATASAHIRSTGVAGGRTDAADAEAQAGMGERLAELAIQAAEREQREAAAQDSSDPYDPYSEGPLARWRQDSRDGRLPSSHSDDSDDDAPSWVHDNMR